MFGLTIKDWLLLGVAGAGLWYGYRAYTRGQVRGVAVLAGDPRAAKDVGLKRYMLGGKAIAEAGKEQIKGVLQAASDKEDKAQVKT